MTEDDSGSSSSDPSEAGLDPDSLQDPGDLDPEDAEEELALARWNPDDETFYDRLAALKDVVPPATRHSLARRWASLYDGTKTTGRWLGGAAWVVTTSLLLVGLPMALSIEGETMLVAQEKEFERQQQGQQVRAPLVLALTSSSRLTRLSAYRAWSGCRDKCRSAVSLANRGRRRSPRPVSEPALGPWSLVVPLSLHSAIASRTSRRDRFAGVFPFVSRAYQLRFWIRLLRSHDQVTFEPLEYSLLASPSLCRRFVCRNLLIKLRALLDASGRSLRPTRRVSPVFYRPSHRRFVVRLTFDLKARSVCLANVVFGHSPAMFRPVKSLSSRSAQQTNAGVDPTSRKEHVGGGRANFYSDEVFLSSPFRPCPPFPSFVVLPYKGRPVLKYSDQVSDQCCTVPRYSNLVVVVSSSASEKVRSFNTPARCGCVRFGVARLLYGSFVPRAPVLYQHLVTPYRTTSHCTATTEQYPIPCICHARRRSRCTVLTSSLVILFLIRRLDRLAHPGDGAYVPPTGCQSRR